MTSNIIGCEIGACCVFEADKCVDRVEISGNRMSEKTVFAEWQLTCKVRESSGKTCVRVRVDERESLFP